MNDFISHYQILVRVSGLLTSLDNLQALLQVFYIHCVNAKLRELLELKGAQLVATDSS